MTTKKYSAQLGRFDDVLAIYGPDPSRWPAGEKAPLEKLARSDRAAAGLLAEARALDRVMAMAPAGSSSGALKERIVAAALSGSGRDARVVPIPGASTKRSRRPGRGNDAYWQAATLAASFALGLYLGAAGLANTTVDQAMDLASLSGVIEDSDNLDFLSDGGGLDQEELL